MGWSQFKGKRFLSFLKKLRYWCLCWCLVASVVSNSLLPHGPQPARPLCPWDSPGKNAGVSCHFLLLKIFLTQGLNLSLLHCRQILYHLSYREVPVYTYNCKPQRVHGLFGTRLHSRRWAVSEQVKLHLYLQPLLITYITLGGVRFS